MVPVLAVEQLPQLVLSQSQQSYHPAETEALALWHCPVSAMSQGQGLIPAPALISATQQGQGLVQKV